MGGDKSAYDKIVAEAIHTRNWAAMDKKIAENSIEGMIVRLGPQETVKVAWEAYEACKMLPILRDIPGLFGPDATLEEVLVAFQIQYAVSTPP